MTKYIIRNTLLLLMCTITSCVTQKQMTYFREVEASSADRINQTFESQIDPTIKAGDALAITVQALDQEAVIPYNLPTAIFATPGTNQLTTTPSLQYYIVEESGYINFPVLGRLNVLGLKRPEVEELIKAKLSDQIIDPFVSVTLINARVTVMGEVMKPGQYAMPNGRMTITDALACAGDLTPYGKRDNLLLTREVNGKLEFARINLNSDEIYTSPYYYLQQNDVIYVSPNKVRVVNSQNVGLWLSMVSTLASAATVIVTVLNSTGTLSNNTSK